MKFSVLAVDYDGTIASAEVPDRDVLAAIGELRARNIVVVIATGRILEDLRRVAGNLHFVDAVVAENGAVLEFPASGYAVVNGDPPPEVFTSALRQEGIRFDVGRVVVEADASDASRILGVIRRLELPLGLIFNRGRVMVLPQTISKATGVRQALSMLRLSPHNAVAIGDAENDHELLRSCEVGVAVAWGSEALKAAADYVLPGAGPAAVAGYIRELGTHENIPAPLHTRRRVLLGHGDDGRPFALTVRGRNVLVAGDPKSGKSWVAGLLCEQLILHGYCVCVFDAEGDYLSLDALPGVRVLGGADPLPRPREILHALRHADVSLVIDLSRASHREKVAYVRTVLPAITRLQRHTGLPHRVVVDEAHYFLHDAETCSRLDLDGYTLVTYRASTLHPTVLSSSQAIVVTRESDPNEVAALAALCAGCHPRSQENWQGLLGGLAIGEAALLPVTEESEGEVRRIRLAPRLTPHVRHMAKYIDMPVEESRAFVFWRDGLATERRARTFRDFVAALEGSSSSTLEGHLRRGDFSRWIADVFGDYPLSRTVQEIEEDYCKGRLGDASATIAQAVRARYEFLNLAPGPSNP